MRRRPPRATPLYSSAASDVYKRQGGVARKACTVACIGCGKCVKVCPFEAITLENNLAYIDPNKCKSCRKCEEACPQNTIIALNFPLRKPKAEGAASVAAPKVAVAPKATETPKVAEAPKTVETPKACLLYTSDAADE